jgi:hypothetical protein
MTLKRELTLFHVFCITTGTMKSTFTLMGMAVLTVVFLDIILVRCREGIFFSETQPPANALFIVVSTRDEHHFYLNILMWITKVVEELEFEHKWLNAKDEGELREVVLSLLDKDLMLITPSNLY